MYIRKHTANYNRDFSLCCGGCEIVRDYEIGGKNEIQIHRNGRAVD